MKKIVLFFCVFVMFSVISCKDGGSGSENLPVIKGYGKIVEQEDAIEVTSLKIVKLGADENVIVPSIERVCMADSILFVKSDKRVYAFDMQGNFLNMIGNRGRGHGEYVDLYGFFADEAQKEVCIIDLYSRSLLYYDYKGKFIRKEELPEGDYQLIYTVGYMGDGKLLCQNYIFSGDDNTLYTEYDIRNKTHKDIMPTPFKTKGTAEAAGYGFSIRTDGIRLLAPFDDVIYSYENGEAKPWARLELSKKQRTDQSVINSIIQNGSFDFFSMANQFMQGQYVGFQGIFETDDFIFLSDMPGMSYFIVNKDNLHGSYHKYMRDYDADDEDIDFLPFNSCPLINIRQSLGNWLVGYGEYMNLEKYPSLLPHDKSDKWMNKLRDCCESMSFDSNPCLLLYEIKVK